MPEASLKSTIAAKVTFPISKKGPFQEDVTADITVGAVRPAAMTYFGVQDDSQFSYVLAHDGTEASDDKTIGDIAGHAKAVTFTLIKKITQG